MPALSHSAERYVVYSVDNAAEVHDDESLTSERRESITFRDPETVDLTQIKLRNGSTRHYPPNSPVPSTITSDKWGSYWSRRERCCCFWNFLMTVCLAVLVTIIVLETKGVLVLLNAASDTEGAKEKLLSSDDGSSPTPCSTPTPTVEVCMDPKCVLWSVDMMTKLNISAEPCQDFYEYACGGYVAKTQVSWDRPRKRVNPEMMMDAFYADLLDGLSEDLHGRDTDEVEVIKTVFQSCIAHTGTTLAQVREVVASLGGLSWEPTAPDKQPTGSTLTQLLVDVTLRFGVSPLFEMKVQHDGKIGIFNRFSDTMVERLRRTGLSRNRFLKPSDYIYRDENTDEVLKAYKTYIGDFLAYIIGINSTMRADQRFVSMIDDIYHLDVYINRVFYSEDMTNLSDGMSICANKMTVDELQYHFNYNISWREYLAAIFSDSIAPTNYNICYVSLAETLSDILSQFSFLSLKRYIIFSVLIQSDIYMFLPRKSPSFAHVQWSSRSALPGDLNHPSDTMCVKHIAKYLQMNYVILKRTSEKINNGLQSLVSVVRARLERLISDMYWMPIKQRQHLLTELKDLTVILGWQQQAELSSFPLHNVSGGYFYNFLTMVQYKQKRSMVGVDTNFDINEESSVFKLNDKRIEIPLAAVRSSEVFNLDNPSIWYGSMGTYISQTVSQLLDIGVLLRFLSMDKIDQRVALTIAYRLQCFVDEYSTYVMYHDDGKTYKVKGDLTKSANFKDSLALRVAYDAYTSHKSDSFPLIPGLDFSADQVFFITYAQTMCEKTSNKGLYTYYVQTDEPHYAPGKYRVIGTLSNFRPFAEAFKCRAESAMNPSQKCYLV